MVLLQIISLEKTLAALECSALAEWLAEFWKA